jgi:hypothetical protein
MDQIVERLRAEFREMPGLRLTAAQTQRLYAIDAAICKSMLDALVETRFLRLTRRGSYARADGPS